MDSQYFGISPVEDEVWVGITQWQTVIQVYYFIQFPYKVSRRAIPYV